MLPPVLLAVFNEDVAALREALSSGEPVDVRDWADRTPLHWACQSRTYDVIRLLVDAGASFSAMDVQNHSPLDLLMSDAHARYDPVEDIDPLYWGPGDDEGELS